MASVAEAIEERLRDVQLSTQSNRDKLESHEEICAVRYASINDSIGDINRNMRWAAVSLLTGMAAILVKLLFFSVHP